MAGDHGKVVAIKSDRQSQQASLTPLQIQDLMSQLGKLLDKKLERIHKHLDYIGNQNASQRNTPTNLRQASIT